MNHTISNYITRPTINQLCLSPKLVGKSYKFQKINTGKNNQKLLPALRRLFTMEERPKRVRLEGIAMEVVGALNGGFNFVTNRTCTRLADSSTSPSISIPAINSSELIGERLRMLGLSRLIGEVGGSSQGLTEILKSCSSIFESLIKGLGFGLHVLYWCDLWGASAQIANVIQRTKNLKFRRIEDIFIPKI